MGEGNGMIGVLSNAERHDQMQTALGTDFPFLKRRTGEFSREKVAIACYGPSLNDTWRAMRQSGLPIISVSGAHDFLVERHCIPTWHVDCDPRPHKAAMLTRPQPEVKYLMASVCHPDFWDVLEHCDVQLWHGINGDDHETIEWVAKHHPAGMDSLIGGGSTAGQRAMNVAAALGYRRFDIYGMDCSFFNRRHAGAHLGEPQEIKLIAVNNRIFKTTPQLYDSAREMTQFILTQDAEVNLHGDGLLQELVRLFKRKVRR